MGNEFDVANVVKTTDAVSVRKEVERICMELYPKARMGPLVLAFRDVAALYRGEFHGIYACDTPYHDIQHALDVTLAMARLMDGYERSRWSGEPLGEKNFILGIVTALFHDAGYLRRVGDQPATVSGAKYTRVHIARGAEFLRSYLRGIGMAAMAEIAAELLHFTGHEKPLSWLRLPSPQYRLLGEMLGSADIIAPMADRCYLEKCHDRLYAELVLAGLLRTSAQDGAPGELEPADAFSLRIQEGYIRAARRLHHELRRCYKYAALHFRGENIYIDRLTRNLRYAQAMATDADLRLRRRPPVTLLPGARAN